MNPPYSLLPLDVGFDLRAHDMPVNLPEGVQEVAYLDNDDKEAIASGSREEIYQALHRAGYEIKPSQRIKPIDRPEGVVLKARPRNRNKRCYELASRFVLDNPTWSLVHSVLFNYDAPGYDYPHAFAEKDGVVYDTALNQFYKKEEYFAVFFVVVMAMYSAIEMARLMLKHPIYGACYAWEGKVDSPNKEEIARQLRQAGYKVV